MSDFNTNEINKSIKQKESEIRRLCSPYNGNCYDIAVALSRIFPKQSEGFWSVYANTEYVWSPDALPLHVVVQIQGELFDAGGQLTQSDLLEEYAPEQDSDLLRFDEEFQYENVVSNNVLPEVIEAYQTEFKESD